MSCLLLTADMALLETVRSTFTDAGIEVEYRSTAQSAVDLASRRHIEAFVIDYDDATGAKALSSIRDGKSNRLSVIFAILNGMTSFGTAVEAGANFALSKPISSTRLRDQLHIALPSMERNYRRYFRHKVDLPVKVYWDTEHVSGKLLNISESGLAFTHVGPAPFKDIVTIRFDLPGTIPQSFWAKAEVVWQDASATGLRFLRIESGSRLSFEGWLKSLEAQLQFREST